jgi:hypothetical protein
MGIPDGWVSTPSYLPPHNICVRPADTVLLREPSGRSEASREQPSGIFTGARRPDLLGMARRSEITVAQVTR